MSDTTMDAHLYDEDFFAWTQLQAKKLKRLQEQTSNLDLDLPHLAEEVEDLGKAEREAVRSQLERIIEHCLTLEYSAAQRPRVGWHDSIDDARRQLARKLTSSLRHDLEQELPAIYERTRRWTARKLGRHREAATGGAFPTECPYKLSELLDEDWFPSARFGD